MSHILGLSHGFLMARFKYNIFGSNSIKVVLYTSFLLLCFKRLVIPLYQGCNASFDYLLKGGDNQISPW